MAEPTAIDNGWKAFAIALSGLVTILWFMVRRLVARQDKSVSKEELTRVIKAMTEAAELRMALQKQMHDTNTKNFERFEQSTAGQFNQLTARLDKSDEFNSKIRHDIRGDIQDVLVKVVAVEATIAHEERIKGILQSRKT